MVQYKENMYALSLFKFNGMTMIRPNGTNRVIHSNWKKLVEVSFKKTGIMTKLRIQSVTLVNNFIWALGLVNSKDDMSPVHCFYDNTLLWSIPRTTWKEGPKLPFDGFDLMSGCVNHLYVVIT